MPGTLITMTLTGTYLAYGQVTGFEYETLPGATVKVTNLRTGQSQTVTADAGGTYSVDLGDATIFTSGYAVGDEIQIDATHRSVTRTWKRRISNDTEIVQDAYFTHGTWKGALRRAKMISTDVLAGTGGPVLTLRDGKSRDIIEVRQNGAKLATTAWTFARPSTLTLLMGTSSSDVIEVARTIDRSIDQAKEEIVGEGDAQVRNACARHYPTPLPSRVPELQEVSEALTAARMRDLVYSGGDKSDAEAASLRKYARDRLKELYDGTRDLTDQDGANVAITNTTGAAPRSSITPTRRFPRYTDNNDRVGL